MTRRDHLERAVLECLWNHPDGLSAPEVVDLLAERELAPTTVHTVLDRLRAKKMVERERDGRVFRHRATRSREEVTADAMLAVLQDSADHHLALSMFVRSVSPADAAALRQALDGQPGESGPPEPASAKPAPARSLRGRLRRS
ncbi:BlaI/MecI/CopY family transcriptional regulator [Kineosporia sp. J2-2]|uniref:BlaI/MecI/CopY family transcriptional regulator n=1 Tax=Kineosporia corallincola TaxID=2835133 RepID=A0ABS5TT17_9ACTN|nr:BlaI/MecI/CopY family transcriptional regulator [Kineosporia corallincola]MBT0773966.1 BlaI/MecI/CopY family transcriptional regulator [Kineosporia corallincola]